MKMKYTEKPQYPEVEVLGKTTASYTGTIDRRKFGRLFLTEDEGFGPDGDKKGKIVLGDETGATLQTVKKVGEIEVIVKLVDNTKSAASFKFFDCWTAKNAENPDIVDIFTTDVEKCDRVEACADRMCEAAPGNDGQYQIVRKDDEGTRVFLRVIAKNLKENGKVVAEGDED
jgi:hypothetical protein